jgi:hypothetical protein
MFLTEPVHFLDSGLEFLLHGQSNFERKRGHAFHQQLADSVIDVISDHSLA